MSKKFWNSRNKTLHKGHTLQPYPLSWDQVLEIKEKDCFKAIGR